MHGTTRVAAVAIAVTVCVGSIAAPAEAKRKPRPKPKPRSAATAQAVPSPSASSIPSSIPGCDNLVSDLGRPVCEIASALGVPAAVFREAFTHVTPAARGSEPSDAQREANHQALLTRLAPYGVTAQLLDEVSDRYRL